MSRPSVAQQVGLVLLLAALSVLAVVRACGSAGV